MPSPLYSRTHNFIIHIICAGVKKRETAGAEGLTPLRCPKFAHLAIARRISTAETACPISVLPNEKALQHGENRIVAPSGRGRRTRLLRIRRPRRPLASLRCPPSDFVAKNSPPDCFLNAPYPLGVQVLTLSKTKLKHHPFEVNPK